MDPRTNVSNLRWVALVLIVTSVSVMGKPTANLVNPIDDVAMLDPTKVSCTAETTDLCQQCAKKTKSAVVYPWCCSNHEGVKEWCEHYMHFGLP